jgi:hypothetical protein
MYLTPEQKPQLNQGIVNGRVIHRPFPDRHLDFHVARVSIQALAAKAKFAFAARQEESRGKAP